MNKTLPIASLGLLLLSCAPSQSQSPSFSSPSSSEQEDEANALAFANSDFESGTLANWESSGDAFSLTSVKTDSDKEKSIRHIEGDFYLDGYANNGDGATGSLLSPEFEVKGNGMLSLKLGGGANSDLCYVSILLNGEEIARKANDLFCEPYPLNRLYRQQIDLSDYLGEKVRLMIVDGDSSSSGWNHLLVDDIRMNSTLPLDDGKYITDANAFQQEYIPSVPDKYRHKYHLMPSYGWMNDPNGFIYDGEKYHLFYQANPYDSVWGNMSWGHATSTDLLHWENEGIAITPDQSYDKNGCFSGGAAIVNGTIRLLYTSVGDANVQTQSVATSYDGVNFAKSSLNPVITSGMSMGSRITDFRDPYVFEEGGYYYALVGGKNQGEGGQLLLYRSSDFLSWDEVGVTYSSTLTGSGMFECPNLAFFGEKAVLLTSPQGVRDDDIASFQNVHSVTYQVGEIDLGSGVFVNDYGADVMFEPDKGFDFYATQMVNNGQDNIMVAWMNHWSRSMPTSAYGWAGEVTLPRKLELRDGMLYQHPIDAVYGLFENTVQKSDITASSEEIDLQTPGDCLSFKASIDVSSLGEDGKAGFYMFKGEKEKTAIYYDASKGMLVFDRRDSGIDITEADDDSQDGIRYAKVEPKDGIIELEVFLDVSSAEAFVNGGEFTMTGLVYPTQEDSRNISFYSEGGKATLLSYSCSQIAA